MPGAHPKLCTSRAYTFSTGLSNSLALFLRGFLRPFSASAPPSHAHHHTGRATLPCPCPVPPRGVALMLPLRHPLRSHATESVRSFPTRPDALRWRQGVRLSPRRSPPGRLQTRRCSDLPVPMQGPAASYSHHNSHFRSFTAYFQTPFHAPFPQPAHAAAGGCETCTRDRMFVNSFNTSSSPHSSF